MQHCVAFPTRRVELDDTTKGKMQLWEPQQWRLEPSDSLLAMLNRDAHGAFMVCSPSVPGSLEKAAELKAQLGKFTHSAAPAVLLVNVMAPEDHAAINKSELDQFCATNGFVCWVVTSVLEGIGVDEAVSALLPLAAERFSEAKRAIQLEQERAERKGQCGL